MIFAGDYVLISDAAQKALAKALDNGRYVSNGPYRVVAIVYDADDRRCADIGFGLALVILESHLTRTEAPPMSLAEKERRARGPESLRLDANLRSVFEPEPRVRRAAPDWSDQ